MSIELTKNQKLSVEHNSYSQSDALALIDP